MSEISLDHDLGDDEQHGTGYDVILWIEGGGSNARILATSHSRSLDEHVCPREDECGGSQHRAHDVQAESQFKDTSSTGAAIRSTPADCHYGRISSLLASTMHFDLSHWQLFIGTRLA